MASSSELIAPSVPSPSFEVELQDTRRKLTAQKHYLLQLDEEDVRRMEMVDKYICKTRE